MLGESSQPSRTGSAKTVNRSFRRENRIVQSFTAPCKDEKKQRVDEKPQLVGGI